MKSSSEILSEQLKQACKVSGAKWAACLKRIQQGWECCASFNLSQARMSALMAFIQKEDNFSWLVGSFSSGRTRYRKTEKNSLELGCGRIYAFANPSAQTIVSVGANELTKEAQSLFRIVALANPSFKLFPDLPSVEQAVPSLMEFGTEVSFDPDSIFNWVLDRLTEVTSCDAAYLAVRAGDIFRISSILHYSSDLRSIEIPIPDTDHLGKIVENRKGEIFSDFPEPPEFLFPGGLPAPVRSALLVPILYGQRVIGLVVFAAYQSHAFQDEDLENATQFLSRISHAIENAIIFTDIARYLEQFALMADLASAAAAGTETQSAARRVVHRLRRTFRNSHVAIFMLTEDGAYLREMSGEPESVPMVVPVESSLVGYAVETGLPIRVSDVNRAPRFLQERWLVRSALVVPLKYSGRVIGTIAVESSEYNAFTQQDEQLLVVIASHMASLMENIRLLEETQNRAKSLGLIHQVARQIVGLLNIDEVAQRTAELVAKYFNFEFAIVLLADESDGSLVNSGVGGTKSHLVKRGYRYPMTQGITGKVLRTGRSYFVNDVAQDPDFFSIPGWGAAAELCVPLREGERTFGLINMESGERGIFSESDLPIFESLAGIVSAVMLNAQRYQAQQSTLRQMEVARQIALDIAEDLTLDTMLRRVLQHVRRMLNVKGALLGLVEKNAETMRIVISDNPWFKHKDYEFPFASHITGRVISGGEEIIINDYPDYAKDMGQSSSFEIQTVLGVPLRWQDQVMGSLIALDDDPGRTFTERDVRLLELIAPEVALSIHNAAMYEELRERMEVQRQTERRLIWSARMAAVGEMAAGVAHELNNPLTTISGFAELALEELPVDYPRRDELEIILAEARRARSVVRRLLDFARPGENVRTPTDINRIVEDVVTLLFHLAQASGVNILTDLGSQIPNIVVDPEQIKQVVLNLVQNSIQAMPHGGTVNLHTSLQPHDDRLGVKLAVIDTGEGISPENQERIFDPFFTTRPLGSGTGLGLSVSYGIVSDHGGQIDVESQVGSGSCFTVWLPISGGDGNG